MFSRPSFETRAKRSAPQDEVGEIFPTSIAGDGAKFIAPSRRFEFLRENKYLARARHVGPCAVEFSHQRLQRRPVHRGIKRGLIGEFIARLV
jgi:hypothetical protein